MKIQLHRNFEKKFVKLPLKIKERFKERRGLFLEDAFNPLLNNHPLSGDRLGQWSVNITGDWRAIYVFRDENTIVFIDIDTHSNLYK
ncbi:MAG: type II toxin-antitoxin system mRNA interferase toxin, RelE/StbE family [Candidatus Nealsonbacteria bacterium]|nr:type II toxin-antitoxin system mRNA interferase toxin, RelE/StbE family [Candidatus Nealsonbacteria bacterium]